jgi:haloalkane dehalogenase
MQQAYMKWLQETDIPKLALYAEPGLLMPEQMATWCVENMPNCESVKIGKGLHYVQEDCPREIGQATSKWLSAM